MKPQYDAKTRNKSHAFCFAQPGSAYLGQLRQIHSLDTLVRDCKRDPDKVGRICSWVNRLWEHDGDNKPSAPDALTILQEVKQGKRFRCVEFGTVVASCAASLGLPSRIVGLKTQDCETREYGAGHVVAEVYLRDEQTWVMVDGQWNVIPLTETQPLSAFGLREAISKGVCITSMTSFPEKDMTEFLDWIDEYLFYFETQFDNSELGVEGKPRLMLVPLGASEPTVFQRKWPMKDVTYTKAVSDFYPAV